MNEILKLGAFELATKIKSKDLSPLEVMHTFIEQAQEWHPSINAVTESFYDQALAEAKAKESELLKNKNLPPLFGVPFSCKEMIAVKGARRTAGNIYFKDQISKEDASIVQRMKKAGAILLATTNVPELGFWYETENVIYGRTNNPHDVRRTCGGSSGGEAAMVSSRGSAFGIGSDIGGSIRTPAFFCGIFGHKPSLRMLPLTGHFPFNNDEFALLQEPQYPYTTLGPLAYKAQDLYDLLILMKGPDGIDPQTRPDVKLKPLISDISKIKVYHLENPQFFLARRADPDVKIATQKAVAYLSHAGCEVQAFPEHLFVGAVEQWFLALDRTRREAFSEILSPSSPLDLKKEFLKLAISKGQHTIPALLTVVFEKLAARLMQSKQEVQNGLAGIQTALAKILDKNSVLILPPHSRTAPLHRAPWLSPFDFIYTGIFNVMDVCSTVCPLGKDSQGLPNGVQIVAGHDLDHLPISVAIVLESAFGGSILPDSTAG